MRLGKEPLLQFALGGALLFGLWAVVQRGKQPEPAAAASGSAAPAVSRTITLDARAIEGMRAGFRAGSKREPTPPELADLVLARIDEEVLFREGQARELARDDGGVRRRIVEKMTALARPAAPTSDPSRDELRRWFETYRHRFVRPAAVTFDQIFFDPRLRADAPAAAATTLASLATAAPGAAAPAGLGDRFVLGTRANERSDLELSHLYGEEFVRALAAAPVGRWHGPLTSRHGLHLVRVVERRAERSPVFEEVEKLVRADWLTVETRGQRAAAESLLPGYEIVLPADVRREVGDVPAMAPISKRLR